jgi:hypothetical protein
MPAPRVVLGRRPPEGYDCRIGTGANVSCGYRDLTGGLNRRTEPGSTRSAAWRSASLVACA